MIVRSQVQENFSAAAAQYDMRASLQQELLGRVLETAREIFPSEARLLDVGCGTGMFSGHASKWQVINLDIAAGMCARAQERGITVQADAVSLPIKSDSLDGVVSSLCLQWVGDKTMALREIARVLRPGGHAVLMTLGEHTLKELRGLRTMRLLPMATLEEYRALAAESGLQLVRCESEEMQRDYASLNALLNSMRGIGAGHAFADHQSLGPQKFKELREIYARRYANKATWQPILLVLKKAAV